MGRNYLAGYGLNALLAAIDCNFRHDRLARSFVVGCAGSPSNQRSSRMPPQPANGWFSRTIVRLSTAAKLTQARYGASSRLAMVEIGANTMMGTKMDSQRNGTSISAQSGRRNLKN